MGPSTTLLCGLSRGARITCAPGNVGLRAPSTSAPPATKAPIVAVLNRRHRDRAGRGCASNARPPRARGAARSRAVRAAAAQPRRVRLSVRARSMPSGSRSRSATACSGSGGRRNPLPQPATANSDADPESSAARRLGCRAAIWLRRLARSTEVGGWDERYFSSASKTRICAGGCGRGGWEVAYEPSAVVEHARGCQHVAPALPHADRTSPFSMALSPRSDSPARGLALAVGGGVLLGPCRAGDRRARVAVVSPPQS